MKSNKITDWNKYYSLHNKHTKLSVIEKMTKATRATTERLILKMLETNISNDINTIIEAGAGDICFYSMFVKNYQNIKYIVIDSNNVGLEVFNEKYKNNNAIVVCKDLVNINADLVFSVGLIEHFDKDSTAKIIKSYFDLCSNTGYVLLTFPTPTVLYKIFRKVAEILGIWKFYDEIALKLNQVLDVCKEYSTILGYKLNWVIGLAQYIVLVKKN